MARKRNASGGHMQGERAGYGKIACHSCSCSPDAVSDELLNCNLSGLGDDAAVGGRWAHEMREH